MDDLCEEKLSVKQSLAAVMSRGQQVLFTVSLKSEKTLRASHSSYTKGYCKGKG